MTIDLVQVYPSEYPDSCRLVCPYSCLFHFVQASTHTSNMGSNRVPFGKPMRSLFPFDPAFTQINHGAYGTCPNSITNLAHKFQSDLNARPDPYLRYEYPRLLAKSRQATADLLHADVDDVVFVPNATTAYNTILRSLVWNDGDVILYYDVVYGTLHKTIKYLEETTALRGQRIDLRFPCPDADVVDALERAIAAVRAAGRTPRIAVFDTVASMPGLRLPFPALIGVCKRAGVLSLVDGAHGIGLLPLDLAALDADFFLSNLHKWLFVPRACAVMHVARRNQHLIRTSLPTSDGFKPADGARLMTNFPSEATAFVELFDYVATLDTQHYLTVPAALKFREEVCGGEDAIREYCFRLAREGGRRAAEILGTEEMGADFAGSCAWETAFTNVRLPIEVGEGEGQLRAEHIVVAREFITHQAVLGHDMYIQCIPYHGVFWMRLSAQVYVEVEDFERAARAAAVICELVRSGEFMKNGMCARCVDAKD